MSTREITSAGTAAGPRCLAKEIGTHAGESVRLLGWIHRVRKLSEVAFVIVRDRSGLVQIVMPPDRVGDWTLESVAEVVGTVVPNPAAPGGFEVHEAAVKVVSPAVEPPPVDIYRPVIKAQLPTILDSAPVSLRHPRLKAIHQLSAASVRGFRDTLNHLEFTEVFTPKIVGSSTESGATVFKLDYFGRPAFLAQSPQFYKQIMVGVFERVYEIGPVFRAEPHDTVRHLAEYTSLDLEMGFIEDHTNVMAVLRNVVAGMVDAVREHAADAVQTLDVSLPEVPAEIPVIHFADGLQLLSERLGQDLRNEPDLAPEHERSLCEWALEAHGSEFVFVTGYPMAKRPFYTHPSPDPRYANGFDLLFRGLELVTGGQRLHRYEDYERALRERGEPLEPYDGYLQVFRHGMPPHGGFALGLERWSARLVGLANVREATLFPRDMHRLSP